MTVQLNHRPKTPKYFVEHFSIIFSKKLLVATFKELYNGTITLVNNYEKDILKVSCSVSALLTAFQITF
jgi:hypothetical protein